MPMFPQLEQLMEKRNSQTLESRANEKSLWEPNSGSRANPDLTLEYQRYSPHRE